MRYRKVVIEHEDGVELGRDCLLLDFFAALDSGMFADEWERQARHARAMLEALVRPPTPPCAPGVPYEEAQGALSSV